MNDHDIDDDDEYGTDDPCEPSDDSNDTDGWQMGQRRYEDDMYARTRGYR
jgi:hypothetical protein